MGYTREIRLKNNEIAAKVNIDTGEIISLPTPTKNNPFATYMDVNTPFDKTFSSGWKYLMDVLSANEIKIAMIMSHMAKRFTNSLIPLNDETTVRDLAELFKVSKSGISKMLNNLFKYGVYGKFEVTEDDFAHKKYWVFNPYLSYNGKAIHSKTKDLFSNTTIAIIVRGNGYE